MLRAHTRNSHAIVLSRFALVLLDVSLNNSEWEGRPIGDGGCTAC
jgi:hypothetical protein